MAAPLLDLLDLLTSWERALRGERKANGTVKTYGDAVRAFVRWSHTNNIEPELTKTNVQLFVANILEAGAEPATAHVRFKGLRLFSKWLLEEGEVDTDELARLRPPKLNTKTVPVLTEQEVEDLLKACKGKTWIDKRDEAIVATLIASGARASEVVNLMVDDLDLDNYQARVREGKGFKERDIPLNRRAVAAIDRYLRARRANGLGDTGRLWVGRRGPFGYNGLYEMLRKRSELAGIKQFHCHRLRHTWCCDSLDKGIPEQSVKLAGGWSNPAMLERYSRANREKRAMDDFRRLDT